MTDTEQATEFSYRRGLANETLHDHQTRFSTVTLKRNGEYIGTMQEYKKHGKVVKTVYDLPKIEKLFIWNWTQGGYNSCLAKTREEAVLKARAKAGDTILTLDEPSLHQGTHAELDKLDSHFAGVFN